MKLSYLLTICSILILTSCSPRLVDTWNIDRYEVRNDNKNSMVSQNIGTITFNKNGSGTKNINYDVFQNNFVDKAPFSWEMKDGYIKINSIAQNPKKNKAREDAESEKSEFNKTWIIVKDKSDKQVWKSTDGKNSVQIIELSK